ncbi:MAG: tRNA 2-thiouridine(34) synthase MnmA [Gammaproteobacteria bacterium]|nr:tRNA 2-thiouridine(34) synthase MnmA [Gammaproteobacteria bacterium]
MTSPSSKRVIVGLSGGVDSSVAALLLQQQGYEVQGLFMSNWEEDEDGYCTTAEDYQDARKAAEHLGIPLHKVSFAREYRERVFAYFLDEHRAGRTPNPDVLCNREIKFGVFFEYARRLGADLVATGHYARVKHAVNGARLLKGRDAAKDQSYFLHAAPATALARTLFPLGNLEKHQVRALAREHGLENFNRKDSTGICFIGERHFQSFLARYLPAQPGPILTPEGQTLGQHQGLMYYTLGQRKGLGIGGRNDSSDEPWFVAAKDLANNVLLVVQGHDHPQLQSRSLVADQATWIAGRLPELPLKLTAKTRYRQPDQACMLGQGQNGSLLVTFDADQRAVTPGQYVVFYQGDECLGGAVIHEALRNQGTAANRETAYLA